MDGGLSGGRRDWGGIGFLANSTRGFFRNDSDTAASAAIPANCVAIKDNSEKDGLFDVLNKQVIPSRWPRLHPGS
jgi:hypothetical protein